MKYGKLTSGVLVHAPNPLRWGGFKTYNPSDALCAEAGYLPIIDTTQPEPAEGEVTYWAAHWEEREEQIVRVWEEIDRPETTVNTGLTWQEAAERRLSSLEATVGELVVAKEGESVQEGVENE